MKTLTFFLYTLFFTLFILFGCRDIFGDRTEPESIIQPPEEGSNLIVTEPIHGKIWNPGDTIKI
ncbi:MAG: hypothetical protein IT277_11620, partial [Ignavibacteriaceae bacterium]|nr:hypothetical protein [Ignavibacteriaceae bacterium]